MVNAPSTGSRHPKPPRVHKPVGWPPHVAIPVAFGGFYMAVAGFSAGLIPVGVAGLLAFGLALGFTGGLAARVLMAVALWAAVTALTAASAAFGEIGFVVIAPAIFCLLFVALGQGIGMILGAAFRRVEQGNAPSAQEQQPLDAERARLR